MEHFFNSRSIYCYISLYFLILFLLAPFNILSFDTYYYWEWSRHLALSYYDGSPMIAYFIRLATTLFGESLFALNFVGIIVTALTTVIIYKSARLFLSPAASFMAMLLWLFSPLVTLDILKQTTYDTPLTLFWALTLYYTIKYIKTDSIKELYFIGVSAGLMMLSKYTGIVLILALIVFLICSAYRTVFKSKHFYLAMLLAIIIFCPVIVWNYQNQWVSFIYQLNAHKIQEITNPVYSSIKSFFITFVPSLNLMLLPPFLVRKPTLDEQGVLIIKLCRIVCFTFLCFYLYIACHSVIRQFWLTPYLVSSAILLGYYLEACNYRKFAGILLMSYALTSILILINNTSQFNFIKSKKHISYYLIKEFDSEHAQLPNTIFTSGWFSARMMFFLHNKPNIYTLGCGTDQNQYTFWNAGINKKLADKTLKEILFIDLSDQKQCLKNHFDQCQKIPTHPYLFRHKEYTLYVYKCQNLI